MKFRLVFETTSKNGHPVVIKFNVPPSKHQGLLNFIKIAAEDQKDVTFSVEKIAEGKQEASKLKGTFKLQAEE